MSKSGIPISVFDGKVSEAFKEIVKFHIPAGRNIIDVTAGDRLLWEDWMDEAQKIYSLLTFTDKKYKGGFKDQRNWDIFKGCLFNIGVYDGLIYDPPYFFGIKKSDDPRKDKYGGYAGTYEHLIQYMYIVDKLKDFLKKDGKIIVKCADQYYVPEKKLYMHHVTWIEVLKRLNFDIIDLYVYRHHRMSPTAFQVKNRQSAVIMHTYFIVGQRI